MSDDTNAPVSQAIRLNVNLHPTVADALRTTCRAQGLSITEGIRRAISIWKLLSDERTEGNRVMVVEGSGSSAEYRELVFL